MTDHPDGKNESLMKVEGLRIGYAGSEILPSIGFVLRPGEVTSIVGHNGSGKSTLLRTLLGLQAPLGGRIETRPGLRLGYVPQRETMDPIYPIRVSDLVETGRYGLRGLGRRLLSVDHEKIQAAMEATGVSGLADRLFRTLSGGEQQRALLARALCTEPGLLVLDEPTASMDEKGAQEAMDLTLRLAREQRAGVLMVNHFIDLVREISDQVILLDRDHQSVRVGSASEVLRKGSA